MPNGLNIASTAKAAAATAATDAKRAKIRQPLHRLTLDGCEDPTVDQSTGRTPISPHRNTWFDHSLIGGGRSPGVLPGSVRATPRPSRDTNTVARYIQC